MTGDNKRPRFKRIAFAASDAPAAGEARARLAARYGDHPRADADVIVALGGDGFMLQTLHDYTPARIPVFGMHRGAIGFLMNAYYEEGLIERLSAAVPTQLAPLRMRARCVDGAHAEAIAFNEVSLLRETRQAAKLQIFVDGQERMPELICDGALVSTPAGSTAYNLSAHGPILPLGCALLALTPISAFRPRRWRGALLPRTAAVSFAVREPEKRPVSAVADFHEVRDVRSVDVASAEDKAATVLFDPDHSLDERLLREQFLT